MSRFFLPDQQVPEICNDCQYYDEDTGECLAAMAIFGDCALLEKMILPEFSCDPDLDEPENDD